MHAASWLRIASAVVGFGILISGGSASGQSSPPEKAKGIVGKPLSTVNLGAEIDGMQGRVLRASFVGHL